MRFMLDWTLFPQSVSPTLFTCRSILTQLEVGHVPRSISQPAGQVELGEGEGGREDVAAGSLAGTRGRLCAHVGEGGREGGGQTLRRPIGHRLSSKPSIREER